MITMPPRLGLLFVLLLLAPARAAEVGSADLEQRDKALFVKTPVIRRLAFSGGLAPAWSKNFGWMYVDKRGKVVIQGVMKMDNGPDAFHDGLVRLERGGKCGFADQKGAIRVPLIYDGCLGFERGKARVCVKCRLECAEKECEHHAYKGGDWRCVGPWGDRVACPPLP